MLEALVRGLTNNEIADRLHVSPRTVQAHIRNLMEKTGTRSRTHLAVKALAAGLVKLPDCDELA